MKRMKIGISILLLLCILVIYLNFVNNKHLKEANDIMNKFDHEKLLDANGNINLSEIKAQEDKYKLELKELFEDVNFDEKKYFNYNKTTEKKNTELEENIKQLKTSLDELTEKKNTLKDQYDVLNNKYQEILAIENAKRSTFMIENVPVINQYPAYPTGCESVALTIFLRYYGVNVSVDEVISKLRLGSMPYAIDNVLYGGNPEIEFIGTPYSPDSFGVYNRPIYDVAKQYLANATVENNLPFSRVLELVSQNKPVVVWTSMDLALPFVSFSWIYKETGENINWLANEHAVVVIGYSNNYVIISDPIGGAIKYQDKNLFEARYNYFGRRAIYALD